MICGGKSQQNGNDAGFCWHKRMENNCEQWNYFRPDGISQDIKQTVDDAFNGLFILGLD